MARARAKDRAGNPTGSGAVVSSSAILDSDPGARRNLIVEGRVDAQVALHAHDISIGATGQVRGDIYGSKIRVEGEVVGDLFGEEEVEICRSGSVCGSITAPSVIVEEGATFEGKIEM